MNTDAYTETFNAGGSDIDDTDDDIYPLRCWDCNVNFTSREYLHKHLFHHIKQPYVLVEKLQLPPLKITLKQSSDNSFEIVSNSSSPSHSVSPPTAYGSLSDCQTYNSVNLAEGGASAVPHIIGVKEEQKEIEEEEDGQDTTVRFSPNFVVEGASPSALSSPASTPGASTPSEHERDTGEGSSSTNTATLAVSGNGPEYGCIPGAEPTPPPEPSPDYPKIRIKTTGLLKEPLTITEITDENPTGDPNLGQSDSSMWATPSLDDPLKLPDSDDNNILALFNNNDKAKDYGFCSTDSEYISLDRLEERNRGTMQLYNSNNSVVPSSNQSPLDQLTGLPMQALAQQVSRLQPSGNSSGMHQQNVLINIQQFPSAPPQPSYQPPPMYPHHQAPMYPPYQYQPPNPMYYPPAPGYPPQPHMPPPPPQMNQMHPMPGTQQPPPMGQPPSTMGQPPALGQPPMSQAQPMNPMTQTQQSQQPQQQSYRQPMPPRQAAPRQPAPGQRMAMAPRGVGNRAPAPRQRMPMMRPRGAAPVQTRGPRPRMGTPQNGQVRPQSSPVKRDGQQMVGNQALKKKKLDLLTPDKDDDDCQVICTQPKNMDGGLPQIESVQGGTSEPAESSIMHLSDSITLSVRNPPPKPAEQAKKSDASAVANILATRGITVTATAKQKEKELSSKSAPALPSSLNLNGAVSILPAANKPNGTSKSQDNLPTVDLTDDAPPPKQANSPQKRPGLPYRCDLCPAQYPNAIGLNKHRQTYHKTTGGMCELGIPLVNLKQPGIMQKLASIGINNYIPLPSANGDGTFGLPIISTRNPGNVSALGATQMLNLGPVRAIPKPQNNNNKPPVNQKT